MRKKLPILPARYSGETRASMTFHVRLRLIVIASMSRRHRCISNALRLPIHACHYTTPCSFSSRPMTAVGPPMSIRLMLSVRLYGDRIFDWRHVCARRNAMMWLMLDCGVGIVPHRWR